MEGVLNLITGAFIAFLPLLFLLLRRRRAVGRRQGLPQEGVGGDSGDGAREAAESVAGPGPGPRMAAAGRSTGAPAVSATGTWAAPAADRAAASTPKSPPQDRGRSPRSTVWQRINRLSPARRAIVTSEIISKPLALRDGQPWL